MTGAEVDTLRIIGCHEWRSELSALVRRLNVRPPASGSPSNPGLMSFLQGASALGEELPEEIRRRCVALSCGTGPAALWFRELPTPSELPATPADPTRPPHRDDQLAETWLVTLGALLGHPKAYRHRENGALFLHQAPAFGAPSRKVPYHTAEANDPEPPDLVLLWCHRGAPSGVIRVASLEHTLPWLDPRDVDVLAQPLFSVQGGDPSPILDPESKEIVVWDPDLVTTAGGAPREALHRLEKAFEWATELVVPRAGDLLIIDNRRAVYGQAAYRPRHDGSDMWLQSMYVRRAAPVDVSVPMAS